MQPRGRFCDAGAPVVNEQGALVALGGEAGPSDGDFLTRLVGAATVRATMQDWRGR